MELAARSQINEAVEKSLHAVALWDEVKERLERSALELSGGQQQAGRCSDYTAFFASDG